MKPGVSLQGTTPLPSLRSAKSQTSATASARVSGPRHHLQQPHVARRVEEVGDEEVPREFLRQAVEQDAGRDGRGVRRDDRARPSAPNRSCGRWPAWRRPFRSPPRRSSPHRSGGSRWSSTLPVAMRLASDFAMKGAGSVLSIRATEPSASAFRSFAPSGTMSSSTTSWPALAMWAAMPPPIRPAPMTAAFWIAIRRPRARWRCPGRRRCTGWRARSACPRGGGSAPPCR